MKARALFFGVIAFLGSLILPAAAQIGPGSPVSYLYCEVSAQVWLPCSGSNPLPVSGTFAFGGGFTAASTGTPISVTSSGVTGTLPAGTVVVATNVGATNGAYCALGASATTASQYLSPGGGWFAFQVGAATQLTCITSTSTTTVNMTGGAGLPTGTGGGSGSSGGGGASAIDEASFTYGSSSYTPIGGVYNSSITNLTSGQGGAAALTAARSVHTLDDNSASLLTAVQAAIPAGTNLIGGVELYDGGGTNKAAISAGGALSVTPTGVVLDPCQANAATILPIAIATGTTTNILTGTSGKKIYVCYLYMQTGIANNVAVIQGTTGGTCGSSTLALVGGTTAATGLLNAANSGQAMGNGGFTVMQTTVNNNDICIITSASGPLSGVMKYVVQ